MPPIMCGKIFEAVKTDVEKRRNLFRQLQAESTSSTTSSMSGYGNNNNTNGVQGTPFSMPWTVVPPVQWSNPPLLSCMAPNNEAPSSSSSSFSGFHGGPLQFPYDRLLQSSVYGRKSGVVLHDHHDSSPMLLSNGPSGMLMDGYGHGGLNLTGEMSNVKMTPQEIIDAKALAASKSHSEAERRRRERINTHLATLRTMLPSTTKTDKASLLAEVIDHVKDLKRQAAEIAEGSAVPTEADEVTVDSDPENKSLIKASVCCDDRPDLLSDLIKALATLNLRTLKAEITTLGGRVNNVLLLDQQNHQNHHYQHDNNNNPAPPPPSLTCIQDALKAVMERPNSEDSPPGNKRQRLNPFNSIHILDHRQI